MTDSLRLIAIAETGNSHYPLAAAASTTRTLATCTATEFQDLSATVAALQTELRRSKDESNSKVAAVTEELRKVQDENVALKAAMDEGRAPRFDDEIKQQLEKLSKEQEEVRNENAALRTQPRFDQETPSPSTTSVTQLEKIVSDFMAHQTLLKQINTEGTSAEMNVDRIIGGLLTFLLRLSETYAYLYSLLLKSPLSFLGSQDGTIPAYRDSQTAIRDVK